MLLSRLSISPVAFVIVVLVPFFLFLPSLLCRSSHLSRISLRLDDDMFIPPTILFCYLLDPYTQPLDGYMYLYVRVLLRWITIDVQMGRKIVVIPNDHRLFFLLPIMFHFFFFRILTVFFLLHFWATLFIKMLDIP